MTLSPDESCDHEWVDMPGTRSLQSQGVPLKQKCSRCGARRTNPDAPDQRAGGMNG